MDLELLDDQLLAQRLVRQQSPTRTLCRDRRLRELRLERRERTERRADGVGQRARRFTAAVGREVRPVDRVENMPAKVEGKALLQADDRVPLVRGAYSAGR